MAYITSLQKIYNRMNIQLTRNRKTFFHLSAVQDKLTTKTKDHQPKTVKLQFLPFAWMQTESSVVDR